jgi:hypothetical protein
VASVERNLSSVEVSIVVAVSLAAWGIARIHGVSPCQ